MKYLVMPSAWLTLIDIKKSELDPKAKKLRRLIEDGEHLYVTGPIVQVVLHAITTRAHKLKVLDLLDQVEYVDVTKSDYQHACFHTDDDLFSNLHQVVAARIGAKILD